MKKIVKPHKARKPSASTDVPSFARGKDQILKSPARLQRRKKSELGEFDTEKDNSVIQNTAAYNQWRSTLPKNLQTETPDYDLYGAFEAGLEPKWDDKDKSYHLGSRDQRTGRILKRPTHPTFSKAIYSDMSEGYFPVYKDGQMYTINPFKYDDGKDNFKNVKEAYDYVNTNGLNNALIAVGNSNIPMNQRQYNDILNTPVSKIDDVINNLPRFGNGRRFNWENIYDQNGITFPYTNFFYDPTTPAESLFKFKKGKDSGIHIKKKNRGKFTALKKRTGKSASWFKEHGTPAQKKMAIFALNARKWKH